VPVEWNDQSTKETSMSVDIAALKARVEQLEQSVAEFTGKAVGPQPTPKPQVVGIGPTIQSVGTFNPQQTSSDTTTPTAQPGIDDGVASRGGGVGTAELAGHQRVSPGNVLGSHIAAAIGSGQTKADSLRDATDAWLRSTPAPGEQSRDHTPTPREQFDPTAQAKG